MVLDHLDAASRDDRFGSWPWLSAPATPAPLTRSTSRARARLAYGNTALGRRVVEQLVSDAIGERGIRPDVDSPAWSAWSEACDANSGRLDFAALQRAAFRELLMSGEVLARPRYRRVSELPGISMQIELLPPEVLDSAIDQNVGGRGRTVQDGIEYDGRRQIRAYHLRRSELTFDTVRVPAGDVAHCYRVERIGQRRGLSLLVPILLRLREIDAFADASVLRQRIAACFAAMFTGATEGAPNVDELKRDGLTPGGVWELPHGSEIKTVTPPSVDDHESFMRCAQMEIAAGAQTQYPAVSGDWKNTNFSAGRLDRLSYQRVLDCLVADTMGLFLRRVWQCVKNASMPGLLPDTVQWYQQRLPSADQWRETESDVGEARAGYKTHEQALRERGINPTTHLAALAREKAERERLGLVFSTDAANRTEQGYFVDPSRRSEE